MPDYLVNSRNSFWVHDSDNRAHFLHNMYFNIYVISFLTKIPLIGELHIVSPLKYANHAPLKQHNNSVEQKGQILIPSFHWSSARLTCPWPQPLIYKSRVRPHLQIPFLLLCPSWVHIPRWIYFIFISKSQYPMIFLLLAKMVLLEPVLTFCLKQLKN